MKQIKLAYIGGGSKAWARVFMNDLALSEGLSGEIALFDIDREAAERNRIIGEKIGQLPDTVSVWKYFVAETLEEALDGADFVAISILPGTFDDMESDVHLPERYGIYQPVGDTVGPGGVLRAMRTVPLYEGFAEAIREHCPDAWVINLTNPMTICCKTLFDVFPKIKAFGCCHEVFHAQEFLSCVIAEEKGVRRPERHEISVDVSGINHFTWITDARWKDTDALKLLPGFMERYYETGYCEQGNDPQAFRSDNPFLYGNKVKMDLFRRYGALAAAGDRHLVEFMSRRWYLSDRQAPEQWLFHLTSVSYRKEDQAKKILESKAIAEGRKEPVLHKSNEELIPMMKAILGFGRIVTNANTVNMGQVPQLPIGSVVETNCVFDTDTVQPVTARPLPGTAAALVRRNADNIENLYRAIRARDIGSIREVFLNQPLCDTLSCAEGKELFTEMVQRTENCLKPFYRL